MDVSYVGSKLFKETFSEEAIFFGVKTTLSMEKRASHQFSGHIPIIFRYSSVPNYCFSREKKREDVFISVLKKCFKGEILICLGLIAHKRGPR